MSHAQEAAQDPTLDDPDPIADDDAGGVIGLQPRSIRGFTSSTIARRLSPRKLLIGLGIGLAILMSAGYLANRLIRDTAIAWIHRQPVYQVSFASIRLDPPPPSWVRSGAEGLLRQVHARSRWRRRDTLPILDLDLEQLAEAFGLGSPWVRQVLGIERRYPNRLTVRLEYREPVARLQLGGDSLGRMILLDSAGVVLPADDLALDQAGPLLTLELRIPDGVLPLERPGRALAVPSDSGASSRVEWTEAACRLAGFLKGKRAVAGPGTNRSPLLATALRENEYGLWIETVELSMILWKTAREQSPSELMTDEEKWEALQDWLGHNRLDTIRWPRFLYFEDDRVRVSRGRVGSAENPQGSIDS